MCKDIEKFVKSKDISSMSLREIEDKVAEMKRSGCYYDDGGNWMCDNRYKTALFEALENEIRHRKKI
jgi:hypothetical protein